MSIKHCREWLEYILVYYMQRSIPVFMEGCTQGAVDRSMRNVPIRAVNRLRSCCTTWKRDEDPKYVSRHTQRLLREAGTPLKYGCGPAAWNAQACKDLFTTLPLPKRMYFIENVDDGSSVKLEEEQRYLLQSAYR